MAEPAELRTTGGAALRRGLPQRLEDEIDRQRLIDRLADRWLTDVLVIDAPAGYGKSTAIAQAIRDNLEDPSGADVYFACRTRDTEGAALAAGLGAALTDGAAADSEGDVEFVLDRMADLAPGEVCLVLDDIHHLGDAPSSIELVASLATRLPANAHLVLAGRSIPPALAESCPAAMETAISQDELAFSADEVDELSHRHGPRSAIRDVAGWPALTRVELTLGRGVSQSFLLEEVVDALTDDQRLGLAATIVGRRVDDDMLARTPGGGLTTKELATQIPLVIDLGDGSIAAHDLWQDVAHAVASAEERRDIAYAVARAHLASGRIDECIEILTDASFWAEAKHAVMQALGANDALLGARTARRWLAQFPASEHDEPELRLLRAITARLRDGPQVGLDDVEFAMNRFRERNQRDYLATAFIERGVRAWVLNDEATLADLAAEAVEIAAAGDRDMAALLTIGASTMADLAGDPAQALAHHLEVDFDVRLTKIAPLFLRSRSTFAFLLGEGDDGVRYAQDVVEKAPGDEAEFWLAVAHWQNGNPEPYAALTPEARTSWRRSIRDEFLNGVFTCLADASFGVNRGISSGLVSRHERPRERTFETLARCAELICAGDEPAAEQLMRAHVDVVGLDQPQSLNELSRFVAYGYVLDDRIRERIEERSGGERFVRAREIARALHHARAGRSPDWDALPEAPEVLCALPLPWSVELAAHAAAGRAPFGLELAMTLIEVTGGRAYDLMVGLADADGRLHDGARSLIRALPVPPELPLTIHACGAQPLLDHGPGDTVTIGARRVRELLGVLILHRRVRQDEVAQWLWPDLDLDAAQNNLRVTTSRLREALEPNRQRGAKPFHLRQDGDALVLTESDHLAVDAWDTQRLMASASALAGESPAASAAAAAQALDPWPGDAFADLRAVDGLRPVLTAWDLAVADAASRVAQWRLAQGDPDAAVVVAEKMLSSFPHDERAHQVLIGAELHRDDLDAAAVRVDSCLAMLADLAVEPAAETNVLVRRFRRRAGRER